MDFHLFSLSSMKKEITTTIVQSLCCEYYNNSALRRVENKFIKCQKIGVIFSASQIQYQNFPLVEYKKYSF